LEIGNKDIHFQLVERAKQNDNSAQFELYNLYSKAMLNVSFRIVNNVEEAEDVLQESFVSAFKKIHSYRGDSTFGAWLKRIVVNSSLNLLKKRKVDFVEMEVAGGVPDVSEDISVDHLSVSQIKNAMAGLPEGFRAVFSMYLLEGYDHQEIAEILNITESTSKSQYNRAKKKMQMLLKERFSYER